MGLIHIALFATLDLVGQGPGGPDEDPVGFPFSGWQAPLVDDGNRTRVFSLGSRFDPSARIRGRLPGFTLRGPELTSDLRGFVRQGPCEPIAVSGGLKGEFRASCVNLVSPRTQFG
jgi:hypothetical protein